MCCTFILLWKSVVSFYPLKLCDKCICYRMKYLCGNCAVCVLLSAVFMSCRGTKGTAMALLHGTEKQLAGFIVSALRI